MSELTLTENAQPALMAVSLAAVRVLETRRRIGSRTVARLRRRPFARRIFGAGGGRRASTRRCGAAVEACVARRCRRRCRSAQGAMAALLGLELEAVARRSRPRRRQGEVVRRRQRQWRGPGRCVSGDKAAVERAIERRQGQRGAKRAHPAAGQRALPLRADGSRRPTRCRRRSQTCRSPAPRCR